MNIILTKSLSLILEMADLRSLYHKVVIKMFFLDQTLSTLDFYLQLMEMVEKMETKHGTYLTIGKILRN